MEVSVLSKGNKPQSPLAVGSSCSVFLVLMGAGWLPETRLLGFTTQENVYDNTELVAVSVNYYILLYQTNSRPTYVPNVPMCNKTEFRSGVRAN